MLLFRSPIFFLIAALVTAPAEVPELRDLDLASWDCGLEGAAKSQDGKERNPQEEPRAD